MAISLPGSTIPISGEITPTPSSPYRDVVAGGREEERLGRTQKIQTTVSRRHYESLDVQIWLEESNYKEILHNKIGGLVLFYLCLFVSIARRH